MRYEFRGKDIETGEWVYGYLFEGNNGTYILNKKVEPDDVGLNPFKPTEVAPETVGQYTGLKDKEGNNIFEGDIVRCESGDMMRFDYNAEVKKTSSGYLTPLVRVREGYNQIAKYSPEAFEIIGTIHDNPELLQ